MRCLFMIYRSSTVIVSYDPSQHYQYLYEGKFLYFVQPNGEETLLVTGNSPEHKEMLQDFNNQNPLSRLEQADLRGAGSFYQFTVDSWYSIGFYFSTPDELQPRILELLGFPP